jgi:hypothetical protein
MFELDDPILQVVGPPGTGKTDVAVQIISNIYHNWPEQRTIIVTHSNQALNQLFEKIMQLDIDERHLLRLGAFIFQITNYISFIYRSWRGITGDREGFHPLWPRQFCTGTTFALVVRSGTIAKVIGCAR